jgi:serine/threonine-protein kinase RsbT
MVTVLRSETFPVSSDADVVLARQAVRKWATDLAFSLVDQTKLVTAASELARNALIYGGGGTMRLEALEDGAKKGLRAVFEDQGPGIPDLALAMKDGYTTGNGLGLGLGGAKRLVNDFEIASKVGEGTRIAMTRWKIGGGR